MRSHFCINCFLWITAFALLGLDQRATAQPISNGTPTEKEPIKLQWKLAEGETLYYEHHEEQTHRASVDLKDFDFTDRRFFLYRWDVITDDWPMSPDGGPMSTVVVSFRRIIHESVSPGRTVLTDTHRPVGQIGLGEEAKQMQDKIFGILRSNYVFFVKPDGGTALPNDLTGIEIPQKMLVPETIQAPRSFTPGDTVGFPRGPVSIGDSWTIPLNHNGITGSGRFRLIGESQRNGSTCLLIEGETSYDSFPKLPNQESIVSSVVGPRTSTYCFDAERGRLIEGNEVTPIEMTLADGQTRNATVRVRRSLIAQPKEPKPIEVPRKLADGKVMKFWFQGGNPLNARGEWADIGSAGLSLSVAMQDNGVPKPEKLIWYVNLKLKRGQLINGVTVYDVTFAEPELLLELTKPDPKDGHLLLTLKEIEISNAAPEWFENDEITERIFKIVLHNDQGDSMVLYQPVLIRPGQLRAQIELLEKR